MREGTFDAGAGRRLRGVGARSAGASACIGLPFGFLRGMRLTLRAARRNALLASERQALSAQTSEAVFVGSINPSRRRVPSWAAASMTRPRRRNLWRRSIGMCDLYRRSGWRCRSAACRRRPAVPWRTSQRWSPRSGHRSKLAGDEPGDGRRVWQTKEVQRRVQGEGDA